MHTETAAKLRLFLRLKNPDAELPKSPEFRPENQDMAAIDAALAKADTSAPTGQGDQAPARLSHVVISGASKALIESGKYTESFIVMEYSGIKSASFVSLQLHCLKEIGSDTALKWFLKKHQDRGDLPDTVVHKLEAAKKRIKQSSQDLFAQLKSRDVELPQSMEFRADTLDIDAIEAALEEAVSEVNPKAASQGDRAATKLTYPVIAHAARALIQDNMFTEGFVLIEHSDSDSAVFVSLQLNCLMEIGSNVALDWFQEKHKKRKDLPKAVTRKMNEAPKRIAANRKLNLKRLRDRIRSKEPLVASDHRAFLPVIPTSISQALAGINPSDYDGPWLDELLRLLVEKRPDAKADPSAFRDRLLKSTGIAQYLNFLQAANSAAGSQFATFGSQQDSQRIVKLFAQFSSQVDAFDPAPIEAAFDQGRSAMITRAHVGANAVPTDLKYETGYPRVLINRSSETDLSEDSLRLKLGTRGNVQADFLKLTKRVKAAPHLIEIYPDGGQGSDFAPAQILGRTIQLGRGAAALAYHSRAATFFCDSNWIDGRLRFTLHPGPVAERGADRQEFEDAFHAFYAARLEAILLGPVEDFAPSGKFGNLFNPNKGIGQ